MGLGPRVHPGGEKHSVSGCILKEEAMGLADGKAAGQKGD